jgi:hypothetical protein
MRLTIYFLAAVLFLLSVACGKKSIGGNGKVVCQQREIKGFKAISIKGAYDVYLKKDDKESVKIETDENLLEVIQTKLTDSILTIYNTKTITRSKELKLTISCPDLNSIDFSGASELTSDSNLIFKDININVSGFGRIEMNLQSKSLSANVSGGAELDFSGKSDEFNVSITGAGNVEAQNLIAQSCKLDISGFGKAKLNVRQKLEVNISGAGKVEYYGNPEVKQSITGAGKIQKKG